jgi:uncharacterized protein
MKIAIAGGSGFIGTALVEQLSTEGHEVVVLSRSPSKVRAGRGVLWEVGRPGAWEQEVATADAVVNLAGENIGGGRWTGERKRALVESRLEATRAIAAVLKKHPRTDRPFVSASAIGFYGSRGDELLDESSAPGNDFLAKLSVQWEGAAREAETVARVVILRFGILLAPDGGALAKMLPPFRMFAGGPQGNGRQWMSWIDRADAVSLIVWAIGNPSVRGIYNAVAPEPVRNAEFAKTLGSVLGRPAFMPAPAAALRLALGEMADALLLSSQRVAPVRVTAEGFRFQYLTLRESLEHALAAR